MTLDAETLGLFGGATTVLVGAVYTFIRNLNKDLSQKAQEQAVAMAARDATLTASVGQVSHAVASLGATFSERTSHIQQDVSALRAQITESEGRVREAQERLDRDVREAREQIVQLRSADGIHHNRLDRLEIDITRGPAAGMQRGGHGGREG